MPSPHGTVSRGVAGCNCFACRVAKADYQAQWKKNGPYLIDGDPTREKLEHLKKLGMSRRAIAEAAGLAYRTLRAIESGEVSKVHPATAEAISSVIPLPSNSTALIPATRTHKVIARCKKHGISRAALARAMGLSVKSLPQPGQARVQGLTALRVEKAAASLGVQARWR